MTGKERGDRNKRRLEGWKQIQKKFGRCTRSIAVEEARDPNHPWHTEFDWSDTSAAHKFRLNQAGKLLVEIHVILKEGTVTRFVYHSPSEDRGREGEYREIDVIATHDKLLTGTLNEIARHVLGSLERAEELLMYTEGKGLKTATRARALLKTLRAAKRLIEQLMNGDDDQPPARKPVRPRAPAPPA